jgi:predicted MFS family arabinose efflux permease
MLVAGLTFIALAGLVARIREPELQTEPNLAESRPTIARDVMEGLRAVWRQPILRGMVVAGLAQNLAFGLVGTMFLLYVNQEVGFAPGILGMLFAVGGVSSFLGAMIAGRLPRFGIGVVMVASLLLAAVGEAFIPLATMANAIGVLFLVGQQIVADSALTVYEINQVSLRQAIAPAHVLGRINACVRVTEIGAVLLGTVVAGYMGETVGLRETLWVGVALSLVATMALALSPVRAVRCIPEMAVEVVR